jgi:hypothetical protein
MRIAEIMNDFRALQYHIATIQVTPRPEEYYLEGYAWLRHSIVEAQAVLAQEYQHDPQHPEGDAEAEKSLLRLYVSPSTVLSILLEDVDSEIALITRLLRKKSAKRHTPPNELSPLTIIELLSMLAFGASNANVLTCARSSADDG